MNSFIQQFLGHFHLPLENPVLIFSMILFIILLAPLIFERLGIPGIIGLIVSGIIIGPNGFNVLEQSLFVEVFSTIGLLYIMFIAGLELNLNEFKANKNKSILFGCFTFFLPILIGLPVCYYLLDFNIYASLLVASIFATHTLVTYPIVSKLGASKDLSVAVTVGGTILTDTAVLVLLAVILGANNGGLSVEFWVKLAISIIVFSALIFLVVPRISAWFFRKMESETYSHYIFVLAMVFLAGFLAELSSLEAIIGAFAAGLALNKLIPNSSALMSRIEYVGNSLFIPFFLVSVGMIVDVRVILSGPGALIIAAALTVSALVGKYLAAWVTQLVFRMSTDQRHLIFGLSTAHAAATLAVLLVGYREGIVGDTVLNAIVIIILVSCVIASFVTERAAKHLVENAGDDADTTLLSELGMEQILVSLPASANVEKLLELAVLIKEPASSHPLALVSVVANTHEAEIRVAMARKKMESFLSETAATDTKVNLMATIDHNTASGIARTVREISADLVVLGWPHSEGLFEKLVADPMNSILHHTVKTLFICHLPQPIAHHKSLSLLVPPNAELEVGFPIWLSKIAKLSTELSLPVDIYTNDRTFRAVTRFCKDNDLTIPWNHTRLAMWSDMLRISRGLTREHFIILVSARKGYISYHGHMDRLPGKLEKLFPDANRILVYPE